MVYDYVGDYTYMWWADGLRHSSQVFNIQTNHYGLSFDYNDLDIARFGPIAAPPDYAEALMQDNTAVNALPLTDLRIFIEVDGVRHEATSTGGNRAYCILVESGRYFQRRWLDDLRFAAGAPAGTASLEIAAWPDRVSFTAYFKPSETIQNAAMVIELDVASAFSTGVSGGDARGLADAADAGYVCLADIPSASLAADTAATKLTLRLPVAYWPSGIEQSTALIVYPVAHETSSKIAEIATLESNPISLTAQQTSPVSSTLATGYSRRYGWYNIALRADSCGTYQESGNNRIERVNFTLNNPDAAARKLRMSFSSTSGNICQAPGISAMLCDSQFNPLGIPLQLSKQWGNGQTHRLEYPWFRGSTVLGVPAQTTLHLNYTSVGAHWGGVAAASHAQLCLVGWSWRDLANQQWDQAALGSWGESITYDPDVCLQRSMVDDVRPLMVYAMNVNTPVKWRWTNNVGGADFLAYWNGSGSRLYNTRMKTQTRRNCPVLTDVAYGGLGAGGAIEMQCATQLYRSDDMVRGIYRLRYDVKSPLTVAANPVGNNNRIAFFQLGADNYNDHTFEKMARGNAEGLTEEWSPVKGGKTYSRVGMACEGRMPWFSLHQANSKDTSTYGAWANRGLIIRSYKARLGGVDQTVPYASVYGTDNGYKSANVELSIPSDVTTLQPGDYLEAELVYLVVPQFAADYYGPNTNLAAALGASQNSWQMVYREAVGSDVDIRMMRGELKRLYPIEIAVCNGAEFEVFGGLGYVPMTFSGLRHYRGYVLEILSGGQWVAVNQAVHGNDFWQTDYDSQTRTWSVSYTVPLDTSGDVPMVRRFRLTGPGLWKSNLNCDERVDILDLAALSQQWLFGTSTPPSGSPHCMGWWPLDEAAGTAAADDSQYLRHGTVNKATNWAEGQYAGALDFDGATTVSLPAAVVSGLTAEVSVCLWVYGDPAYQPQNQDVVFHASAASVSRILLCHLPWIDGQIIWDAGYADGSYDRIAKQAQTEDYQGRWNHWVFTKNTAAGTMNMYLNGQLWHSGTGKTKPLSGATQIAIGSYAAGNGAFYQGKIDDFRVYDVELSDDQILRVYQGLDAFVNNDCDGEWISDLNRDCRVDLADVTEFTADWLLDMDN